jgi:prevent-host-death family protein
MKFISSRELRINPGAVWKRLREEQDLVITSNGKPIGVLTFAEEENLETVLTTLRQGRAQDAVAHLRREAVEHGLAALRDEDIAAIISKTRRKVRKVKSGGKR